MYVSWLGVDRQNVVPAGEVHKGFNDGTMVPPPTRRSRLQTYRRITTETLEPEHQYAPVPRAQRCRGWSPSQTHGGTFQRLYKECRACTNQQRPDSQKRQREGDQDIRYVRSNSWPGIARTKRYHNGVPYMSGPLTVMATATKTPCATLTSADTATVPKSVWSVLIAFWCV